jgi:hypothetical protein
MKSMQFVFETISPVSEVIVLTSSCAHVKTLAEGAVIVVEVVVVAEGVVVVGVVVVVVGAVVVVVGVVVVVVGAVVVVVLLLVPPTLLALQRVSSCSIVARRYVPEGTQLGNSLTAFSSFAMHSASGHWYCPIVSTQFGSE